jgi:hypothetical protein
VVFTLFGIDTWIIFLFIKKKNLMIIFYFLLFLASLPIIAYLLSQKTNNKGIIFGSSILVLSLCLIIFISKFAVLGDVNNQMLSDKILDQIYIDSVISKEHLKEVESSLSEEELKIWMISLISKSIELNKLKSAESMIAFSESFFNSNNEKVIFYELYTNLRDAKFPEFTSASFDFDKSSKLPCLTNNGIVKLFIMNGPDIPIAQSEFTNIYDVNLTNADSIIPGFDLASAYLNNETIELEINIFCINSENFISKNLIVLNKNSSSNTYKINSNEWLKKPQEL